jgi:hypothetical protein
MAKTNKELNQEHDQRAQARVRPKTGDWNFGPLEAVMAQWVQDRMKDEQARVL